MDYDLRIPPDKATDEQLQEAINTARDNARRCESQGGFYALHTHGQRADHLQSILDARRRSRAR